ncbi:MAG: DNA-binding protein, partial [Desulfovibrionaceae bacterium]
MAGYSFENVCIFHILDGLRDGLSHFASPTRVALLYCIEEQGKPYLWDPQDLLRGHEPKLQEFYLYSNKWRKTPPDGVEIDFLDEAHYRALDMAGIIAFGGRSRAVAYQMWFTEHQPDICCTGPIKRWLEYAVRLLAQNYEMQNVMNIDTAGHVLQQCAVHAVRDHIVDERSVMGRLDTQLRIYPVLDAVLGISRTLEEGKPPKGTIAFVEPSAVYQMNFMALFDDLERPQLDNFKHVRKMLQCVEGSERMLISDGRTIAGVATGTPPDDSLVARFQGSYGFLSLNGLLVCSFSDGGFRASNRKPNLVQLEEQLLES